MSLKRLDFITGPGDEKAADERSWRPGGLPPEIDVQEERNDSQKRHWFPQFTFNVTLSVFTQANT